MSVILPPAMLGILGGGQLGRMFTVAAKTAGYCVTVLDPDPASPAAAFADQHLCAAYDDPAALQQLATNCAAITTEFENVNADSMRWLAQHARVSPSGDCVAIAQDRIQEKAWIHRAGLNTAPYLALASVEDLNTDLTPYLPGIVKTARLGYDGKGQVRVASPDAVRAAYANLGGQACVLEKMLSLVCEVSVIVARSGPTAVNSFPVSENQHVNGILDMSIVPARVASAVGQAAQAQACALADTLDYIGVLAVEFFVLDDQRLVVNEMAPRPHNSGHYTLDACIHSQFEQQVRTLCGMAPGDSRLLSPVVMVNLLGDSWPQDGGQPNWRPVLSAPNSKLHLYGKEAARPGRKMGHYTVLGDELTSLISQAHALKKML